MSYVITINTILKIGYVITTTLKLLIAHLTILDLRRPNQVMLVCCTVMHIYAICYIPTLLHILYTNNTITTQTITIITSHAQIIHGIFNVATQFSTKS